MKRVQVAGKLWILAACLCCILTTVESATILKETEDNCHPTPQSLDHVYIVGYGSLLNTPSKSKTYPDTGPNIPVNVNGFSRKWNCKGTPIGLSTTFLGVDEDPKGYFNGVVFKLPNLESLKEFDKRERFYCRREVLAKDIKFLVENGKNFTEGNETKYVELPPESSQFWVYTVKEEFIGFPSEKYPIVQSYVDVFLGGCLEMEKTYTLQKFNYSDNCISTTEGWEFPWVNDRLIPRRPWANTPNAFAIDSLITKHMPELFENVVVEHEIKFNVKKGSRTGSLDQRSEKSNAKLATGVNGILVLFLGIISTVF